MVEVITVVNTITYVMSWDFALGAMKYKWMRNFCYCLCDTHLINIFSILDCRKGFNYNIEQAVLYVGIPNS